jgi:hypothetical protein
VTAFGVPATGSAQADNVARKNIKRSLSRIFMKGMRWN